MNSIVSDIHGATAPVSRHRNEQWLFPLVLVTAIALWVLLAVSIIGLIYAALIGAGLLMGQLLFVAFIRGNGVRLGPSQLPDLHQRVVRISERLGFSAPPDAYVVQAGGTLNAMAGRMLGRDFIVLYSDLIDACEDNGEAIDFIVAHELGHLRAGHLRFNWLLLPGYLMPFLGAAYSRAREFTADRYGISVSQNRERALEGLIVLAAGGKLAARVNRRALVNQESELLGPLMRIAHWMSSHPPIPTRLAALDASLVTHRVNFWPSAFGAWAVLATAIAAPTLAVLLAVPLLAPLLQNRLSVPGSPGQSISVIEPTAEDPSSDAAQRRKAATDGIVEFARVIEGYRARHRGLLPIDQQELYVLWEQDRPGEAAPMDPWSGERLGYATAEGGHYFVFSAGADGVLSSEDSPSADDLYYSSAEAEASADGQPRP